MSFSKEYAQLVRDQKDLVSFLHPLISGGEFSHLYKKENRCIKEFYHIMDIAKSREWEQVPSLLEALHNPATAIVLTDKTEKIEWVNTGFHRMTGYSLQEVVGRRPNFLQGKDTRPEDVFQIRQSMPQLKPFSTTLLNYRKTGEAYQCNIEIIPLFKAGKELVNFLAIEQEVLL